MAPIKNTFVPRYFFHACMKIDILNVYIHAFILVKFFGIFMIKIALIEHLKWRYILKTNSIGVKYSLVVLGGGALIGPKLDHLFYF